MKLKTKTGRSMQDAVRFMPRLGTVADDAAMAAAHKIEVFKTLKRELLDIYTYTHSDFVFRQQVMTIVEEIEHIETQAGLSESDDE